MIDTLICDFDDTLVESYSEFLKAEAEFLDVMKSLDLPHDQAVTDYLHAADIANVERAGFLHPSCFPLALRQTYEHFGPAGEEGMARRMEDIGWQVFRRQPPHREGAEAFLQAIRPQARRMILLTQGDQAIQQRRISQSGLDKYFDHCRILRKKQAVAFQELMDEFAVDADCSWMLGDSLKSDIGPALAVGLNAAHLSMSGWVYERSAVDGNYHAISKLEQFLELIKA